MKRISIILIILLSLPSCIETIALGSAGTLHLIHRDKSFKNTISDTKIAAKITSRLDKKTRKRSNINVSVYEGRVLLTGRARNRDTIRKIVKTAWNVRNVKEVINEIKVNSRIKSYNKVTDTLISARIKNRLLFDKHIKTGNINVNVMNKTVYLLGELKSKSQIIRAAKIASKVPGVQKVVSHIRAS